MDFFPECSPTFHDVPWPSVTFQGVLMAFMTFHGFLPTSKAPVNWQKIAKILGKICWGGLWEIYLLNYKTWRLYEKKGWKPQKTVIGQLHVQQCMTWCDACGIHGTMGTASSSEDNCNSLAWHVSRPVGKSAATAVDRNEWNAWNVWNTHQQRLQSLSKCQKHQKHQKVVGSAQKCAFESQVPTSQK